MLITHPYICPLTLTTMKDPVLARDGYCYERNAITKWINEHGNSPETNEKMTVDDIIPNDALRDILSHTLQSLSTSTSTSASSTSTTSVTSKLQWKDQSKLYQALYHAYSTKVTSYACSTQIPSIKSINCNNKDHVMIHIDTPDIDTSNKTSFMMDAIANHHICCVIDISGSMSTPAISKNENGSENDLGLSILDVVKFATLVVAKSLRAEDQLSIVTFTDKANVILKPTSMNDTGKNMVATLLQTIKPVASTNLWDGIQKSIALTHEVDSQYLSSIFVLTDGIPNVHPTLGYTRPIKRLLESKPIFGSLSTFGFGYSLDSPLLKHIAKLGGGTFSFIPDSGFVGTSIINAIANARCSYGIHPYLCIQNKTKSKTTQQQQQQQSNMTKNNWTLDGQFKISNTNDSACIHMSPLRYGSSLNIVLQKEKMNLILDDENNYKMELVFHLVGNRLVRIPITLLENMVENTPSEDIFPFARSLFLSNMSKIISKNDINEHDSKSIIDPSDITFLKSIQNDYVDALLQDVEGQVCEALSKKEWYKTWGKHYLHSLTEAHLYQICNNFKDPGVQVYGNGQLFTYLQEELNDIFEKIPAPKPSIQPRFTYTKQNRSIMRGPRSMSFAYNSRSIVCMHAKTKLTTIQKPFIQNQNKIPVSQRLDQIQKGDFVLTESGTFVKVACIIETVVDLTNQNPLCMVKIGNLIVTPYHPIKLSSTSGNWSFPMDIPQATFMHYYLNEHTPFSVYNLILEEGQRQNAVMMDGIACITLAHGIHDNPVLQHEYFGTNRIVNDIIRLDPNGWKFGHVVLYENSIRRNSHTGLIDTVGKTIHSTKSISVHSS